MRHTFEWQEEKPGEKQGKKQEKHVLIHMIASG
jgi:hypothetical protein